MPLELIHKYCSSSPHRHRRRRRRHNNYWHQFECASCIVHCAPLHRTLPHTHIHCRRYQFQSNSRWVKPPIFILRLNWFISSRVIGFGSVWYAEINLSSEERERVREKRRNVKSYQMITTTKRIVELAWQGCTMNSLCALCIIWSACISFAISSISCTFYSNRWFA